MRVPCADRLAGLLCLALSIAGCGPSAGRLDDVQAAAEGFLQARDARDGAAACALLAPETKDQLEQDQQQDCTQAVVEVQLPAAGGPETTRLYSGQALVVSSGQRLYLARFPDGWRVTAAGCQQRPELPDDCEVQG